MSSRPDGAADQPREGDMIRREIATGKQQVLFPLVEGERDEIYHVGAAHLLLHQAQFDSEGHRGNPMAGENGERAWLKYPTLSDVGDGAKRYGAVSKQFAETGEAYYRFPSPLVPSLPHHDAAWKFKTCAIVGNSGESLHHSWGREIDGHDVVIRINNAPVKGFEQHVGYRTTFSLCNHHHLKLMMGGHMNKMRDPDALLVMFESTSYQAYFHMYARLVEKYPPPTLTILSPDFGMAAYELWRRLVEAEKEPPKQNKPTSGWFALVFASQMCDHISLYGFHAYHKKDEKYKGHTKYHYFDDIKGETGVHSFDLSMRIYQRLVEDGFPISVQ